MIGWSKPINDAIDRRHEAERDILYQYYKKAKYLCNEDARGAVSSHFGYGWKLMEQGRRLLYNLNNTDNER